MRAPLVVTLLIIGSACQPTQTARQDTGGAGGIDAESRAARPEIERIGVELTRLESAGLLDSAAMYLTEDMHWLPPNAPEDSGRAKWVSTFGPVVKPGVVTMTNTTESVVASGPLAISRGHYVFTPGPKATGMLAVADTGK